MSANEPTKGGRYNNYDLLRCFCLAGVFCLHMQRENVFHQIMACLGMMSVPLFFMMSGAFTMTDSKTVGFGKWMKKTFHKLMVPWLCAILLYLTEGLAFQYLHTGSMDFHVEIDSLLKYGYPTRGWHLWYMYALTEMYMMVPLFRKLKQMNAKAYYMLGVLLAVLPCPIQLPWYLSFIKYISLYIAGDFVFSYGLNLKRKGFAAVCCVLILSLAGFLAVNAAGIDLPGEGLITLTAELSIMLFFSNIHVGLELYPLTRRFMAIYILHIIVGDFWVLISRLLSLNDINAWWTIVVDCCVVFTGCYFLCIIGEFVYRKFTMIKG